MNLPCEYVDKTKIKNVIFDKTHNILVKHFKKKKNSRILSDVSLFVARYANVKSQSVFIWSENQVLITFYLLCLKRDTEESVPSFIFMKGRYTTNELLGEGRSGKVYRVVDSRMSNSR